MARYLYIHRFLQFDEVADLPSHYQPGIAWPGLDLAIGVPVGWFRRNARSSAHLLSIQIFVDHLAGGECVLVLCGQLVFALPRNKGIPTSIP